MGFDRVRFFEGAGETPSTLITADKMTADVVYGKHFRTFLGVLGYRAVIGFDEAESLSSQEVKTRLEHGEVPILYPDSAKKMCLGRKYADGNVVIIEPPLEAADVKRVMRYIDAYAEPSDAGPLYLDHRGEHESCSIGWKTGEARPHAEIIAERQRRREARERAQTALAQRWENPDMQNVLPPPLA